MHTWTLSQANQHLGPLQISLGCMLIDVAKFLFIFFLVLTSFACGFNQLYWYYRDTGDENVFFTSVALLSLPPFSACVEMVVLGLLDVVCS